MNVDPIVVEVIKNALIYASEEMGIAVRNSAYSPNIKERLDHSCALFDARGRLIAQAEHIPVHLGSLPWGLLQTMKAVTREYGEFRPGEMWVANDPYVTGTHLNDVTVIRPIFFSGRRDRVRRQQSASHRRRRQRSRVRCRSMRADLFAEGLVVPPMRLVEAEAPVVSAVELFRANSRTPEARGGDLRAQIAGNYTGERRLIELCERYTAATPCSRLSIESSTPAKPACATHCERSATAFSKAPIFWKIRRARRRFGSRWN